MRGKDEQILFGRFTGLFFSVSERTRCTTHSVLQASSSTVTEKQFWGGISTTL